MSPLMKPPVRLRCALSSQTDNRLLPGMFVRARLDEGVNPTALLVPQTGVTRTPTGDASAMVVGADNKVEVRKITANQAFGDKWLVTDGLKEGDRVITVGIQRAKAGAQVTPKEVSDDAKAAQESQSAKSSS